MEFSLSVLQDGKRQAQMIKILILLVFSLLLAETVLRNLKWTREYMMNM